jgi:hypothetical protein
MFLHGTLQYFPTLQSFDENVANNKAAYPCAFFQFYVADGKLSYQLYQSADIWACPSILLHMHYWVNDYRYVI